MRAEIINVTNGTLQGNKFTMVRGDTFEVTLRVIKNDESPLSIDRFEPLGVGQKTREPNSESNNRLSMEFRAEVREGGEVPVIYRTTEQPTDILYGPLDELTVVIDQNATKDLPAPITLNFDMQLTEFMFGPDYQRVNTVYQGSLQIEKDYTRKY